MSYSGGEVVVEIWQVVKRSGDDLVFEFGRFWLVVVVVVEGEEADRGG